MAVNELTEYLKTAFDYKNAGNYKESIDYFYKALALDNESIEILKELASLYAKLYKYDRSISLYEQIISKEENNKDTKFRLAKLFKYRKMTDKAVNLFTELYNSDYEIDACAKELFEILSDKSDWTEIIELFNKNANKLKDSVVIYYAAYAHLKAGNNKVSMEYFKKAYETDEGNIAAGTEIVKNLFECGNIKDAESMAYNLLQYGETQEIYSLLSDIAYQKSDIDTAIKYGSYAVNINQNNAEVYFKLAILFSLKGYVREAEECYCKAISIEPDNIYYNYALAYEYYMTGKKELSVKLTDFILDKEPDNVSTLSLKALILTDNNDLSAAKLFIDRIDKVNTESDFPYYVQAKYYSKLNMYEHAVDSIKKAINNNEQSIEYKYMLSQLYYELGKFEDAKNICEKIIEKESKYVQAYILLAKINKQKHDYYKVNENTEKILKLDRNIPEIYCINAEMFFEQKNYEKAVENYKIAVSMLPDDELLYVKIAQCYYELENYKEAYEYYKEASDFDVSNAEYRYYMAKCCMNIEDAEGAKYNFSLMKRLAPNNVEYIKAYADYMYSLGKKRSAKNIISSLLKLSDDKVKDELKQHMKAYK